MLLYTEMYTSVFSRKTLTINIKVNPRLGDQKRLPSKNRKEAKVKQESSDKNTDGAPPVKTDKTTNKESAPSSKIHKLSDKKDKVFD